jgi:succinate dehydrogenase / fumarate reductase cytochrome b subunit
MTLVPEMVYKYVEGSPLMLQDTFHELAEKFESPVRTALHCVSFVFYHYT